MKQKMLAKMFALAAEGHKNQYTRDGLPYIMHPIRVMELTNTSDEELKCIALGHDLVEDTDMTVSDIRKTFGDRVADAIDALSKRKDTAETYQEYLDRVATNQDAIRVKMADLTHNSDPSRLNKKELTDNDLDRIQRYLKAYVYLKSKMV